ncbi:MAG TPA: ABC transporter substrate-binding protein [Phototrophicaceae bacterium]|nr:ABC transporter substrate-binding protein [Phototrophicaceae bacterium]
MSLKRMLIPLLILLIAVGVLNPVAAQSTTLRMALQEGDANSLDPQQYQTLGEFQILSNVYDGLVRYNQKTLQPEADLATSWDVSADGLTYTFHLRSGVTFTNGRALTADDVVYSFNRLANAKIATTYATSLILGSVAGFADVQSGAATTLSGVKAVDPQTVQITLSAPNSALLPALTMVPAAIIPKEAADDADTFGDQPVGTGPYMVKEWVKQDHITLDANPNYWGGKPAIDEVIMRVIPEKSTALNEFEAGNLDMVLVPPSDIARYRADATLSKELQDQAILSIFWLPLNLTVKPLDNVKVRQAMSYAIDRQSIVDNILQGQGKVAQGPLPPGLSAYDPNYNPFPFDPDKAKQLLSDAGYPNGIDIVIRNWNDEVQTRVMTAIQSNWADVGIRATFDQSEYTDYINDMGVCKFQVAVSSWTADYADADDFINPLPLSDLNTMGKDCGQGQYPDAKNDALKALTLPLGADRDKLYQQAQDAAAYQDVLGIFLYNTGATLAVAPNVQGAYLDGFENIKLAPITLSS